MFHTEMWYPCICLCGGPSMGTARDNLLAYRDTLVADLDATSHTLVDMRQKMVRGVNLRTAERWQYSLAALQSKLDQQKTVLTQLNAQIHGRRLHEQSVHEFAALEQALKAAQQDLSDTVKMLAAAQQNGGKNLDKLYASLKQNGAAIDRIVAQRKRHSLTTTTEGTTMSVKRFSQFISESEDWLVDLFGGPETVAKAREAQTKFDTMMKDFDAAVEAVAKLRRMHRKALSSAQKDRIEQALERASAKLYKLEQQLTESNVLQFPASKWQKSPEPPKPAPKAASVKSPKMPTSEATLDNEYCFARYTPKDKQIFVRDKVDRNNEPAAYTKTKRGIEKTWAAVEAAFKHGKPKFRDITSIFTETGQQYHYWCMMD